MGSLTVRHQGIETTIGPAESLTFGRQADLVIDDNPYLHRHLGLISDDAGVWVLSNVGSTLPMWVRGASQALTELVSGSALVLVDSSYLVTFSVGRVDYELAIELDAAPAAPLPTDEPVGPATTEWGVIPLNFEQRRLLAALAEPRLLGDPSSGVPSNKDLMVRLQLRRKQFDSRLDHLCKRYSEVGVPGLTGGRGGEANDRRQHLVDHVINHRIITSDDLALLR